MIRKATKYDYKYCIKLLKMALGDIAYQFSGTNNEKLTDEFLQSLYSSTDSRISYKNITVYEKNHTIVGIITSYFGYDVKNFDKDYKEIFEQECFDDELYIDTLAVDEKFQNQGVATSLIKYVCSNIYNDKISKISLLAIQKNKKNINFYKKLGFKTDKILNVYNCKYEHMIKEKNEKI